MSDQGESDTARLARESERTALAKAAAELEAEREAMRAEFAAIEEEERLEAERVKQLAKATQTKTTESGASPVSARSASTELTESNVISPRPPKSTKSNSGNDGSPSPAPSLDLATDQESKSERKERKDKKKDSKQSSNEDGADLSARKERTKEEKDPKSSSPPPAVVEEPMSARSKSEKKDKKDKKQSTTPRVHETELDQAGESGKDRKDRSGNAASSSGDGIESESKKSKDKKKGDKTSDEGGKSPVLGDKKDKLTQTDPGEKSGEKSAKDKRPKKGDRIVASSTSTPSAASSSSSAALPPVKTNAVPSPSASSEDLSARAGPKPITRVESTLKIPVLDLSNRRLTELPVDIGHCTYLTKLYLSRNMLTDTSSLSSLRELQVLTVSNNSLPNFPVGLSSATSKLKDLLIGDNCISSIPKGVELHFPHLSKLDLMANKFTEIPAAILTITTLTNLNMSWNQITEVPKGISALTQLTTLLLHHNVIKRIASGICQLSQLSTLDLQDNALVTIPESIAELASLASLNISHNQLKDWPTAFAVEAEFFALTHLNLSHNQITGVLPQDRFPEEATLFPAIEELYLNNNMITGIPDRCWRNLASLAVLDVRNNQLTEISPEIESWYSLSTLELGSNRLTSLPPQLGTLANLQILSCYGNQLTSLPDISALEYLQYLNIGYNQVTEVVFDGLSSLEEVFLSGNPIKQLPDTMADSCPNLKLLFAADLLLKKTPAGLEGLVLLEQIDFSFNRITEIPTSLGDLESLRSISFAHCKLESSKEREVLKTPGKGPWDCIEFWQNFSQLLQVDLSFNKLKYLPKGLETKIGTECELLLFGNPLVGEESKSLLVSPQLGKRFQVGWSEMLGRRPTMEDQFLWQGAMDGNTHIDLFAVFDGHAARDAARFCSQHLPNLLSEQLAKVLDGSKSSKMTKSDTLFHGVFSTLNAALEKHLSTIRDTSVKHCGTTAVVVLIVGDTMQIANVGDSRAVLNSGERCTVDDKPRSEVDRIRSTPGGFVTGDGSGRINEVLAVSRSLGDFYMAPWVTCEPHVYSKTLTKEDKYIILACDGIWDEVDDKDAVSIVDPLIQEGELFKASSKLRDMAYCAGSDDNISVMIIKLSSK